MIKFTSGKLNSMSKERIDLLPSLFIQAELVRDGKVSKHRAAETVGRERIPQILASGENIKLFFDQVNLLEGKPREIAEKMCGRHVVRKSLEEIPEPAVFSALTEMLTSPDDLKTEIARNLLEGIFLYPREFLGKELKNLQEAIKVSAQVLYNFTWAMVLDPSRSSQEAALDLYQRHLLTSEGLSLFDLAGRPQFLSSKELEQYLALGIVAMATLDLLLVQLFGGERYWASRQQLKKRKEAVKKQLVSFPLDDQRKERAGEMSRRVFEAVKIVEEKVENALSEPADVRIYYPLPEKEPLLSEAIRLKMEMVGESLKEKGIESIIVDLPEGGKELIFYEASRADQLKEARDDTIRYSVFLWLAEESRYTNRLNCREIETIIEWLGPEYPLELLRQSCEQLCQSSRTGILALPKAGQRVRLRLQEEQWLREMGLESIFFKPYGEGRILVKLEFDHYRFSFTLDKNFLPREKEDVPFPEKFSHLPEKARLFLLTLTYSYLDSLLHPERKKEEILGFRKRRRKEEAEFMSLAETKGYLRQSRTFLRVLPLGHRCRQLEDIEVKEKVNKRIGEGFGFSLDEIWHRFLSAQADFNTLDELRERKPRLYGLVKELIDDRVSLKPDGVEWVSVNRRRVMRVIEKDALFSLQDRVCYEVTAVLCQESLHPKEVVCPKAAARISIAMAGSAPATA